MERGRKKERERESERGREGEREGEKERERERERERVSEGDWKRERHTPRRIHVTSHGLVDMQNNFPFVNSRGAHDLRAPQLW